MRVTTRHFVILLAAGAAPESAPRLGIVASRKVGGAVVRNRAKRLVREAFRIASGLFPPGVDAVVVVRPAFAAIRDGRGGHGLGLAAVAGELDAVRGAIRRAAAAACRA
jgi:ribonuclease P protein component